MISITPSIGAVRRRRPIVCPKGVNERQDITQRASVRSRSFRSAVFAYEMRNGVLAVPEPVPKNLFKQFITSAIAQTPARSLTTLKDFCQSDACYKLRSTLLTFPNKQDCLTQRIRYSTRAGGPYSIEWTQADTEDSMKIAISWLAD
jgi:hypothetical protein